MPRRRPIEELDQSGNEARLCKSFEPLSRKSDSRNDQMAARVVAHESGWSSVAAPGLLRQTCSCLCPGAELRRTGTV